MYPYTSHYLQGNIVLLNNTARKANRNENYFKTRESRTQVC